MIIFLVGQISACVRVCASFVLLSMFDMEKRYRNKIIIIIITTSRADGAGRFFP